MIKKGILGGSFDPVHAGHIGMALTALQELELDEVILQPNRIPYYKKQAEVSDADRLEMLRIAVAETGRKELLASDFELREKEYLSTSEVLLRLRKNEPETALVFIMGMDSWLYFHKWRNYKTVLETANIAVFNRPGHVLKQEDLPEELAELHSRHLITNHSVINRSGGLYFIESRPFDISSTTLRNLLREGCSGAEEYMSAGVLKYIREHGLYGNRL